MNAHDMADRIRGIVERDSYLPVDVSVGYAYDEKDIELGWFEVTGDHGKRFRVSISEVAE